MTHLKLLLLGSAMATLTSASHAQKPIELTLGSWHASTASVPVGVYEPWKKLVEEKSAGRIKVNIFNGGVLGASKTVLDDVKGGVYDVGYAVPSYYYDSSYFPLFIGELPFATPDSAVGMKILGEYANNHYDAIFGKLGVKNMGVGFASTYAFFNTTPIHKVEDLNGKRIRVTGRLIIPAMKAWGAVPTPIPPEDTYTAIERGTVDGVLYSMVGADAWKYPEVAPYVTDIKTPAVIINFIMNQGFYDRLPGDLKKLFDEELNPALVALASVTVYSEGRQAAVDKIKADIKNSGRGEYVELSPEEHARFVAKTESTWRDWVAEADKRGYDGKALLEEYRAISKKNGVTLPF